jgi:AraC family transcriptional regulator
VPKDNNKLSNTNLPYFDIYEGICATFEVEGKYGDILKLIQWVYHHWLPNSGFETTTIPSYTIFEKNHFLSDDRRFKCTYYVPVRYV